MVTVRAVVPIRALRGGATLRRIAERAAVSLRAALEREYATGRTADGRPWAPLAKRTLARGRRPPPLTDTGLMRRGMRAYPAIKRIVLAYTTRLDIAPYHQRGTRYMPARPVLPVSTRLPRTWAEIIRRIAFDEMRRAGGGST